MTRCAASVELWSTWTHRAIDCIVPFRRKKAQEHCCRVIWRRKYLKFTKTFVDPAWNSIFQKWPSVLLLLALLMLRLWFPLWSPSRTATSALNRFYLWLTVTLQSSRHFSIVWLQLRRNVFLKMMTMIMRQSQLTPSCLLDTDQVHGK